MNIFPGRFPVISTALISFFCCNLSLLLCSESGAQVVFQDNSGAILVVGTPARDEVTITFPTGGAWQNTVRVEFDGVWHVFSNPSAISVLLLDGNDSLSIGSLDVPGYLYVDLGEGDDTVRFSGNFKYVDGDFEINLGSDDDRIFASQYSFQRLEVGGDFIVSAGTGNDDVDLTGLNYTRVHERYRISAGSGINSFMTSRTEADGEVRINMRGTDDTLVSDQLTVGGDLVVDFGYAGRNDLQLSSVAVSGSASMELGDDRSTVHITDSVFSRVLRIEGGAHEDSVVINTSMLEGEGQFIFGGGRDHLLIQQSDLKSDLSVTLGAGNDIVELFDCNFDHRSLLGVDGGSHYDRVIQADSPLTAEPRFRRVEDTNY